MVIRSRSIKGAPVLKYYEKWGKMGGLDGFSYILLILLFTKISESWMAFHGFPVK